MLFIKYISDKYADSDEFAPPVTIPKGASFTDMVKLKGTERDRERASFRSPARRPGHHVRPNWDAA